MWGARTTDGTVGVWVAAPEAYGGAARAFVVEEELARRMPGSVIRRFSPVGHGRPNRFDAGRRAEELGPWSPQRIAELAEELDCIVVVGDVVSSRGAPGPNPLIEGLGPDLEREVPFLWSSVGVPFDPEDPEGFRRALEARPYISVREEMTRARLESLGLGSEIVPDPVFLLPRIWGRDLLERRLRHLRAMGWYPEEGWTLVAQGNAAGLPHVEDAAAAIDRVAARHEDATVVIVSTGPIHGDDEFAEALERSLRTPTIRVPEAGLQDIAAAIALSDGFVGSSLHGNITAAAYERPHVVLGWGGGLKLKGFAELIEAEECLAPLPPDLPQAFETMEARGPRPDVVAALQDRVDRHLDHIAEIARESAARRAGVGVAAPDARPPAGEETMRRALRDLREAYEARGRLLALGRWAVADEVARQGEEVRALREEVAWLRRTVADLRREVEQRQADMDALLASRTWRYTAWARALARLVRRVLGRG